MTGLIGVVDVAKYLGVSKSTVYRYTKKGLPYYKDDSSIRSRLSFKLEEVEDWINNHRKVALVAERAFKKILTSPSRIHIDKSEGGQKVAKKKTRHNYGYGSVYVRKTKKGIPRYYIEYYNKSGKRIQQLAKSATSWNEAKSVLDNAVYNVFSQELEVKKDKGKIMFKRFSQVYLEDYAMIQKKAWERSDKVYLNASLIPYFGRYEIRKITQHSVEQLIRERLKCGVKKSTINRELSCLSMMFHKAIDWGYLSENPVAKVKRFKEKRRERVPTFAEFEQLYEHSASHLKLILLTEFCTGMRRGELLNLKWSQIDFEAKRIRVENTKSGQNRIIPLNSQLHDISLMLKERNGQSPYVFPNPDTGKPYTTIKTAFKAACRRANIVGLCFHDLRHMYSTQLLENGNHIETVRDLMGHASIITTGRYVHTNEERKRSAVESLTRKVKKLTENGSICYTDCYTGTKCDKEKEE